MAGILTAHSILGYGSIIDVILGNNLITDVEDETTLIDSTCYYLDKIQLKLNRFKTKYLN